MASETWSAILSGCPSVTDSEVNKKRSLNFRLLPTEGFQFGGMTRFLAVPRRPYLDDFLSVTASEGTQTGPWPSSLARLHLSGRSLTVHQSMVIAPGGPRQRLKCE